MTLLTPPSPHIHAETSVRGLMLTVIAALLPAAVVFWWFFGNGFIVHLGLAWVTALASEALMLKLRNRSLPLFLGDGSALVTATLLAFCIPTLAPWWITVIGVAFAIVVAKHLYGGLGYNLFNPAMVGYVLLLISFPLEMTSWLSIDSVALLNLDLPAALQAIFSSKLDSIIHLDGVSAASPLDYMRTEIRREQSISSILENNLVYGAMAGIGWTWVNIAIAFGGLILLARKVINWHIPVAMLSTMVLCAGLFYLIDAERYADPLFHLFSGATMLGAFFIATDPVSACTTNRGRLIYGALTGLLTYIIRTWGGYADGVAFAVLLMNMAAPAIDYYTRPRTFGYDESS